MSFNLMDSIKSLLGTDFISKASSVLGEGETKMQSALSVAVPSVLTGVLNKASVAEADGVLRMAKETANSGILSNICNFISSNALLSKGMARSLQRQRPMPLMKSESRIEEFPSTQEKNSPA